MYVHTIYKLNKNIQNFIDIYIHAQYYMAFYGPCLFSVYNLFNCLVISLCIITMEA